MFFYCSSVLGLFFIPFRDDFLLLFVLYLISVGMFFSTIIKKNNFSFKSLGYLFIFLAIVSVFSTPVLSNDFYRFLWDGELFVRGVNPYDYTPMDYAIQREFFSTEYYMQLYDGMGNLSQQHYSCYPPVSIYLFGFCSIFTNDLHANIMIMHVFMLLFQLPGIYFGKKICEIIGVNKKCIFLLFLHPLYLVEVLGNLHFEGVMIPLLLTFLYFFHKKLIFISSFFMALAIHIKLIPILFFGAIFSFSSPKKVLKIFFFTVLLSLIFSLNLFDKNNFFNFLESLKLYFGKFEFYSFVYVYFQRINLQFYLTILNVLALGASVVWIVKKKIPWQNAMPIILTVFYLFSGTVHPWYLTFVLLFAPFSQLKSVLIYPTVGFVSYLFYDIGDGFALRFVYMVSYLIVVFYLIEDLKKMRIYAIEKAK